METNEQPAEWSAQIEDDDLKMYENPQADFDIQNGSVSYGATDREGLLEGDEEAHLKETLEEEALKLKKEEEPVANKKPPRLVSLDVFRGCTVALMIAVDEGGEAFPHIDHSPWNGFTLADCVMPFFLIIMGVAIPLAIRVNADDTGQQLEHSKKVIIRVIKLFLLGLIYSNYPCYYLDTLRISGILQRLAWGYLVCGLTHIWVPEFHFANDPSPSPLYVRYLYRWLVVLFFTVLYLILIFAIPVPDCGFASLTPDCNTPKWLDPIILGGEKHLYQEPTYLRTTNCSSCSPGYCQKLDAPEWCYEPFDPEGPTTSMGVVFTTFLGCWAGYVVKNLVAWKERLAYWMATAAILAALAIPAGFLVMPVNKNMWSISYQFLTGAMAFTCLSICFLLVDILPNRVRPDITIWIRRFFTPAMWMGMNPLLIFMLATTNVPFWWIWDPLESWLGEKPGTFLFIIIQLTFWFITAGILYWQNWFWRV